MTTLSDKKQQLIDFVAGNIPQDIQKLVERMLLAKRRFRIEMAFASRENKRRASEIKLLVDEVRATAPKDITDRDLSALVINVFRLRRARLELAQEFDDEEGGIGEFFDSEPEGGDFFADHP